MCVLSQKWVLSVVSRARLGPAAFCFRFSCRDDAVEEEAAAAGEAEGEAEAEVEGEGEAEQAVEDTEEWDVFHDDSGTPFFTNRVTGESVWDKPETFREWEELLDADSGVPYYFNRVSNETVWERPAAIAVTGPRFGGVLHWPESLFPQQATVPSCLRATVW